MLKKYLPTIAFCLISLPVFATPEYDSCYAGAQDDTQLSLCMKAETTRLMKKIQDIYSQISKDPQIASWNNGNGLISGNLKDMYDNFIAYRNRYCSLFVVASEKMFGSEEYDKERCLLNITNDHYELMDSILLRANSGGEELGDDNEE